MTELSDRYRRGAEKYAEIYPGPLPDDPTEFQRNSMENLFAEYWFREGLSVRDRRLLILGVVAAQGNTAIQRLQFQAGLEKGDLTESDLTEIPIFLSQYAGFPLSVLLNQSAEKAAERVRERDGS